jgi:hypothetical protein
VRIRSVHARAAAPGVVGVDDGGRCRSDARRIRGVRRGDGGGVDADAGVGVRRRRARLRGCAIAKVPDVPHVRARRRRRGEVRGLAQRQQRRGGRRQPLNRLIHQRQTEGGLRLLRPIGGGRGEAVRQTAGDAQAHGRGNGQRHGRAGGHRAQVARHQAQRVCAAGRRAGEGQALRQGAADLYADRIRRAAVGERQVVDDRLADGGRVGQKGALQAQRGAAAHQRGMRRGVVELMVIGLRGAHRGVADQLRALRRGSGSSQVEPHRRLRVAGQRAERTRDDAARCAARPLARRHGHQRGARPRQSVVRITSVAASGP